MQGYKRLVAWLVAPRQVNRTLLRGDAGGVGDVLVFLFVVMLGARVGALPKGWLDERLAVGGLSQ